MGPRKKDCNTPRWSSTSRIFLTASFVKKSLLWMSLLALPSLALPWPTHNHCQLRVLQIDLMLAQGDPCCSMEGLVQ